MRLLITAIGVMLGLSAASGSEKPRLSKAVPFDYPRLAHFINKQGKVKIALRISNRGAVDSVNIKSGPPILVDGIPKNTLKKWQFSRCTSKRIDCIYSFTIEFRLEGELCYISECPSTFEVTRTGTVVITAHPARAIID